MLMRWIVGSSLRFRWLVVFAAAALIVFGIGETRNADVDVFPEFAPPSVEIQTIALGNSSAAGRGADHRSRWRTSSTGSQGSRRCAPSRFPSSRQIELIFERETDLYEARQLVQERLTEASPNLPTWAGPPWMMPPLSSTSRIMKIGISSDELNMREMSMIAYWKIRAALAARARRGERGHLG